MSWKGLKVYEKVIIPEIQVEGYGVENGKLGQGQGCIDMTV